ncbi:MAG: phosphoglycerate kinase [Bacillota bacterium]
MAKVKSIRLKRQWKGVRVLLRVDFNVPKDGKNIAEDFRITAALPTLRFLISKGARVIILSHWGDPKGWDKSLSTKPLAARLSRLSKLKIKHVADIAGKKALAAIAKLEDGEVLMLENVRFEAGEKDNSREFAKQLASLAEVYVNDAFSVCHRDQASVSLVSGLLPSYAGLQVGEEIRNLDRVLEPQKPLIVIMGGSKIATKAPLIRKLYPKAEKILLGGGLANTFLKWQGKEIGKSLADDDAKEYIEPFFVKGKLKAKIILPVDAVVESSSGRNYCKIVEGINKGDRIFDIGPETVALFSSLIKKGKTIVWNGPLGKFEDAPFRHGTQAVAEVIAARSTGKAFGLVGGGETVDALKRTKMESYVDWVSTAGGAMLSYLGGEKLPGLKNILK